MNGAVLVATLVQFFMSEEACTAYRVPVSPLTVKEKSLPAVLAATSVAGGGLAVAGKTQTENVLTARLLYLAPSLTVTVMMAVPLVLAAGLMIKVPVVLGLAYLTVGFGTTLGLLEVAVIRRA